MSATPNQERDAWGMATTIDHSSIRVLANAFHRFFAGLPRSENGDHHKRRSLKTVEGSPHRSHASRSWFGMVLMVVLRCARAPVAAEAGACSGGSWLNRGVPSDIPDKTGHSRRNCTFQGLLHGLGLPFLSYLKTAVDLGIEAAVPARLDQHPACVRITTAVDRALSTAGAARVFRRDQAEIGHQRPWMSKAREVADLGNERDGGDEN